MAWNCTVLSHLQSHLPNVAIDTLDALNNCQYQMLRLSDVSEGCNMTLDMYSRCVGIIDNLGVRAGRRQTN